MRWEMFSPGLPRHELGSSSPTLIPLQPSPFTGIPDLKIFRENKDG